MNMRILDFVAYNWGFSIVFFISFLNPEFLVYEPLPTFHPAVAPL
jgi:hypothetical protein